MSQTITLSFPQPDIAVFTLDMPDKSANILSRAVLDELDARIGEIESRHNLKGLVILSGKPGMFIAGADLREFVASLDVDKSEIAAMCGRGQSLFARLSKCPFVTVAAIDGICVGGGAELAVWCDRRIMSNHAKAEIGFPEVKLGLFPGWGGTARLPRIVGLGNAVTMITGGDSINAAEAAKMGLISDVVPSDDLLEASVNLIRCEHQTGEYLQDRQRWSGPIEVNETEFGFLGITASAYIRQQTKGQYPAPESALEVMLESAAEDIETACKNEAQGMADLFGSPVNAALLNIFFLTDRNKKDRGVENDAIQPRELKSAAVLGAGIMGAGIASANIKRGIPVVFSDVSSEALAKGAKQVLEEASYNRETKSADAEKMASLAPLLNVTSVDAELADCDVVIEAIVERADIKKQVFARIEPQLKDDAILASNTSTIPITELAKDLQRPEQFCGIHFFNPVRRMKLVEVIRGEKTSDETVAAAVAYAKKIGKSPIVVNDGPGFLVNRLLFPYLNEAIELLSDGAPMEDIEKAAKKFGMPMGPFALNDMVGLDTAVHAGRTMYEAFPKRFAAHPLIPAMVKSGRLGEKNGKGFFNYENKKKKAQPDPQFQEFLKTYLRDNPPEITKEDITNRLFLPMLIEAARVLEAGIVRDPRDADLGLIFGIGFPPFKGGLLFWADTVGAPKIMEMLEPYRKLGERFEPTELMKQKAEADGKYYE